MVHPFQEGVQGVGHPSIKVNIGKWCILFWKVYEVRGIPFIEG